MVTVPHEMVRLERMLDYRGVGLQRIHCTLVRMYKRSRSHTTAHSENFHKFKTTNTEGSLHTAYDHSGIAPKIHCS